LQVLQICGVVKLVKKTSHLQASTCSEEYSSQSEQQQQDLPPQDFLVRLERTVFFHKKTGSWQDTCSKKISSEPT
jgi:hypothetical protein